MQPQGIKQMSVEELSARLKRNEPTVLIDVRQPWEHALASLPGSQLLPLNRLPTESDVLEIPEGSLVVVYCHHGIRSLSGAAILQQLGTTNVVSLAGGIDAWSLRIDPAVARY